MSIYVFSQPSTDVTLDEFERVFNVNVKSIFLASQTFIPKLLQQGVGGSIINVSSTGAQRPRPGLVWYNASKGAVSNVSTYLQTIPFPQETGRLSWLN
jgi:NAD(P)-dependent dehydrogenase (short-subunit alcohol dehydrogenase family)